MYGLEEGALEGKGHYESLQAQGENRYGADSSMQRKRRQKKSGDLMCYWRIYSKMGFGPDQYDPYREMKDQFRGLPTTILFVVGLVAAIIVFVR